MVLAVLCISSMCFMLYYTVVEYLSRQANLLVFPNGRPATRRSAALRRRLLRLRSNAVVRLVWWLLFVSTIAGTCFFGTLFVMYIILGACVVPERLVPILLGLVAVVFVAKSTYESLKKLQEAVRQSLESLRDDLKDTAELTEAVEDVLRDLGFNSTQIVLITAAICVQFAALVAFVLLGCSLFVSAESLVPSLISSAMVIVSALTAIRSGTLPADYVKRTGATAKLNEQLLRTTALSSSVTELAESKDKGATERLDAAGRAYAAVEKEVAG